MYSFVRQSIHFPLRNKPFAYLCLHVGGCVPCVQVEVRGQLVGVCSLFVPCRFWGLKSGHRTWGNPLCLLRQPQCCTLYICLGVIIIVIITIDTLRIELNAPHGLGKGLTNKLHPSLRRGHVSGRGLSLKSFLLLLGYIMLLRMHER